MIYVALYVVIGLISAFSTLVYLHYTENRIELELGIAPVVFFLLWPIFVPIFLVAKGIGAFSRLAKITAQRIKSR
jgi:hypothetical protein